MSDKVINKITDNAVKKVNFAKPDKSNAFFWEISQHNEMSAKQ